MLVTSLGGLGAAFVEGTDFNCKSSQCYGIGPARDKAFKDYQILLNRFATALKFSPLTVDGFIGSGTVKATRKVAAEVIKTGLDLGWVKQLAASDSTMQQVAARVSDFSVVAQGLARSMFPASAPIKQFGFDPRRFPLPKVPANPGIKPGTRTPTPEVPGGDQYTPDFQPDRNALTTSSILALSPTGKKVLFAVGLGVVALFLYDRRAKQAPRSAAG